MNALAIFDLDDTLIDTQGILVPAALEAVARAAGCSREELNARGKRIDEVLEGVRGLTPDRRAAAAAAWYDPSVPPLEPAPGAVAMLEALQGRIHLALLTRGDPVRQRNKLERCGLGPYFEAFRIRLIEGPGSKRDDILALMQQFRTPPERTVVIGDDERDELLHGESLGCATLPVPRVPLSAIPAKLGKMGYLSGDQG